LSLQSLSVIIIIPDHQKLQSLAKEIFNDWDAVVAFVHHPELPSTNNDAERALRHAVIA
jgi:transposase